MSHSVTKAGIIHSCSATGSPLVSPLLSIYSQVHIDVQWENGKATQLLSNWKWMRCSSFLALESQRLHAAVSKLQTKYTFQLLWKISLFTYLSLEGTRRSQRATFRSQFSPFTIWLTGIEARFSLSCWPKLFYCFKRTFWRHCHYVTLASLGLALRPGWPWTCNVLPASVSQLLELKAYTISG